MKTKLGISVNLFGAALYFTGLISSITLVLIAGYVLIFESDEWLKKTAVKSVGIVIVFTILSTLVGLVDDPFNLIREILGLFNVSFTYSWLNRILSICRTIISFQSFLLIVLGLAALKKGDVKLGSVDNVIEKNM